jgi:hypothetical protein
VCLPVADARLALSFGTASAMSAATSALSVGAVGETPVTGLMDENAIDDWTHQRKQTAIQHLLHLEKLAWDNLASQRTSLSS